MGFAAFRFRFQELEAPRALCLTAEDGTLLQSERTGFLAAFETVWDLEFRLQGLGSGVLGFRLQGLGSGVWGFRFSILFCASKRYKKRLGVGRHSLRGGVGKSLCGIRTRATKRRRKLQTLNPKLQSRNPKLQTLNPSYPKVAQSLLHPGALHQLSYRQANFVSDCGRVEYSLVEYGIVSCGIAWSSLVSGPTTFSCADQGPHCPSARAVRASYSPSSRSSQSRDQVSMAPTHTPRVSFGFYSLFRIGTILLSDSMLCYAVLYHAIPYSTPLYSTRLYCY